MKKFFIQLGDDWYDHQVEAGVSVVAHRRKIARLEGTIKRMTLEAEFRQREIDNWRDKYNALQSQRRAERKNFG